MKRCPWGNIIEVPFHSPTINRDIPKPMWDVLAYLSTVSLKGNIGGVFGSYGWSGEACRMAEDRLKSMNFKMPHPFVRIPFMPRPEDTGQRWNAARTAMR